MWAMGGDTMCPVDCQKIAKDSAGNLKHAELSMEAARMYDY